MPMLSKTVEVLTASTPLTVGKIRLQSKYGELLRLYVRNFADSTKAGAGTDVAQRIKITDGNSNVVYLDASDRDYATAQVILAPSIDDTATGLGVTAVDATGAAATAGAGSPIIMRDPVTVTVVNAGTATDYLQVTMVWRV